MAKSSYTLHPNQYFDKSHTVLKGGQEGIDTFDGIWSRKAEGVYSLYDLAFLVAYLQLNLLGVEFPRTSRSGPSDMVLIVPTPATRDFGDLTLSDKVPYPVNWRVWQEVVVPVLGDSSLKLNNGYSRILNGLNQPAVILNDLKAYIKRVNSALRLTAQQGGFIVPPNKGANTASYAGLYITNGVPEQRCCCGESNPNCCGEG